MRRVNIFSLVGVIFFNLVVMLGAAITIYALLGAAWIISGSFLISPLLIVGADVMHLQAFSGFQFALSIGLAIVGMALVPLLKQLTHIILSLSKSYVAWNLKAIYA